MPSAHHLSFRQNPWVYFSLFLVSNTLISYSHLSIEAKCVLGLLGVILPLYVAFRTVSLPVRGEKPSYLLGSKGVVPFWVLGLALAALVFLRFYKLETFSCWPNLDEGWIGISAIELSRHWTWKFFYTFGETPPLSIWCPALLFKLDCSPTFSLWFSPAAVSLLTVIIGYFASRQFFSKSFSLIGTGLMAFSYWPLHIGRICHQGIWLPLWVCLVFFFWGGFQKAHEGPAKRNWAISLGLSVGFGSFTFTPWLLVAAVFFLSIAVGMLNQPKKDWRNFCYFYASLTVALIPFLLAVFNEGYGGHILSLSPWGGWFHGLDFFSNLFRYFAVLIWDSYEQNPAYTPIWGGFLNPVLGSLFFIGVIAAFRLRRQKLIQWIVAVFLLFLLPGVLSPNLETFRVAQVLPLLIFITALGIQAILQELPSKKQITVLGLLLIFTAIFDFNLLIAPYRNPAAHPENFGRPLKSLERYRAYNILEGAQENGNPGVILASFDANAFNDPTLPVMTKDFLQVGPGGKPAWIALFVNAHYEPFLKKRFPEANWFWVGKGLSLENGGHLLGLLPFTSMTPEDQETWITAHGSFRKADLQRFAQNNGGMKAVIETLEIAYPLVKGDPFLESVYWDKLAAYEYEDLNYEEQLRAYQMAVTRGYPTADLYFKLGELYRVKGHYAEARQAYLKATQAPLDLTPSRAALEWLKAQPIANSPIDSK